MSFIEELSWRGLIKQMSHEQLDALMRAEKPPLYSGFDPSAPSLHVGNLMPLFSLRRAQLHGHKPVALVGGATGMIGDPSGKSNERKLLEADDVEANVASIKKQMAKFLDPADAIFVNNADWFKEFSYLGFLRDVGKHFSVNMMMAKDSVRTRLEDRESGISYTEFSYMLIQAYDYLWLHQNHGCRLQIGGSEQWGNIVAGMDLIRKIAGKEAYALTLHLLLDASGKKFGKSESGAVYLDPEKTAPYDFYQYFMRCDDRDVPKLLRFLTFFDQKTIAEIEEQLKIAPEKREAQRALARELTTLVHGKEEMQKVEAAAAQLFSARQAGGAPPGAPSAEVESAKIAAEYPLTEALVACKLCQSKGEAKREIESGGIYVNEERVPGIDRKLSTADVRDGLIVLRRGKKNYLVLKLI